MFGKGRFPAAAILIMVSASAFGQDAGSFTQAQVTAGRQDYLANCATCHGANLGGGANADSEDQAPPLTGETFNIDMASETIHGLYKFIATAMPNGSAGSLSPETYRNIVSFILAANGAKSGPSPLNDESDVKVSTIANGQPVAAVINGDGGRNAPQPGLSPP